MTTIQKTLFPLGFFAAVTLFSCGSDAGKTEETSVAADTTAAVADAPAPAAFTPFDVVEISHTVKDYAKWKPVFDLDSTERRAVGLKDITVGHRDENPNNVLIVMEATDLQKAKDFAANPRLKEVMQKGGVTSKPRAEYFHVIRMAPAPSENDWLTVHAKVKDFDAWLKVFDAEGAEARASQGLIDVVIARVVDEPNTVHLVFDTKDMAKAKATLASAEKKKLMDSAGVIGAPRIEYYHSDK